MLRVYIRAGYREYRGVCLYVAGFCSAGSCRLGLVDRVRVSGAVLALVCLLFQCCRVDSIKGCGAGFPGWLKVVWLAGCKASGLMLPGLAEGCLAGRVQGFRAHASRAG